MHWEIEQHEISRIWQSTYELILQCNDVLHAFLKIGHKRQYMRWVEENCILHQLIEKERVYRFNEKTLIGHLEQFHTKHPSRKFCRYYYLRLHLLINSPVRGARN